MIYCVSSSLTNLDLWEKRVTSRIADTAQSLSFGKGQSLPSEEYLKRAFSLSIEEFSLARPDLRELAIEVCDLEFRLDTLLKRVVQPSYYSSSKWSPPPYPQQYTVERITKRLPSKTLKLL